ncbi:hypothetical protein M422DRAFT_89184, partial [Sphaerobolus stellatus SS14]
FRLHLHQHPEIPCNDEHGTRLSPEEIHYRATHDMYIYCLSNNLSQVWAYLWNRWYCPGKWELWARSASPAIPRLKTTMVVESLWKVLKRHDLIHFNRPRLDLVTHIVLNKILPRITLQLTELRGAWRKGRPQQLAAWQKDFKHDWVDMSKPDLQRSLEIELEWRKKPLKTKGRAERLADIES